MPKLRKTIFLTGAFGFLLAGLCLGQFRGGGGRGFGSGESGPIIYTEGNIPVNEDTVQTARETVSHSTGTPNWTNAPGFEKDAFTFARIIYRSDRTFGGGRRSWWGWLNDYPDSDLNLSWRLQQMTSMKVDPDGRVLRLTDAVLADYPFIYMVKPGRLDFREEEIPFLRKYLLNGGMLMADDFWGTQEWATFESQIKRVFPQRHWVELPMDHPIFHCVFNLNRSEERLQVPSIHLFERTGSTSRNGEDSIDVHVRAWLDDRQRIMILATHNTDNGDGG